MVSLTGGDSRGGTLGQLSAGVRRLPAALATRGSRAASVRVPPSAESAGSRVLRLLPARVVVAEAAIERELAGLPAGAIVSVGWRLGGAGRVVGATLPPGHPRAGRLGARVLAGEGVWPATMWPASQEVSPDQPLIELAAAPARLVVHAPDRDISGVVDQPYLPGAGAGRLTRMVTGLRRDSHQVRVRAAERTWWLRASGVFGVRVSRGGQPVFTTQGMLGHFEPDADDLDVSVVLVTLASLPSSTYAPILGF